MLSIQMPFFYNEQNISSQKIKFKFRLRSQGAYHTTTQKVHPLKKKETNKTHYAYSVNIANHNIIPNRFLLTMDLTYIRFRH